MLKSNLFLMINFRLEVQYMVSDEQRFVSVQSDGTVRSQLPCTITNKCEMQIDKFPYDIQSCDITVGSWMYSTDQIDFVVGKEQLNATIDNGYFKVIQEIFIKLFREHKPV